MNKTTIRWTTVTWNPVHGCTKVSEGCRHCYAETLSRRFGLTKKPWTKPNEIENVQLKPHKLGEPRRLKEPSRIFVNSMSDLFHDLVPDDYRVLVFDVMESLPQHVFQILTKRPRNAAKWQRWPANVWMGVSVEDEASSHRIDTLRETGAHTRFISFEPLIGEVTSLDFSAIDWVIVGGESGPGHRPMDQAWARRICDASVLQEVAYFYKQDSGYKSELRPWLVEDDGTGWEWQQYPGDLVEPRRVSAENVGW